MSRRIALTAAILLGIAAFLLLRRAPPAPPAPATAVADPTAAVLKSAGENPPPAAPTNAASPIADDLNAPAGNIRRDLAILDELFGAYHTNFPRLGNPVGENHEITAALLGDNPANFPFLAAGHRALNARRELCDRWGTPFRFHQVSGTAMEIRSAGPDRKFATADDAVFTP